MREYDDAADGHIKEVPALETYLEKLHQLMLKDIYASPLHPLFRSMFADKISDAEVTENQAKEEKDTDKDAYFVDTKYDQIDILKALLSKVKDSAEGGLLDKDLYIARKAFATHMEHLIDEDLFSLSFILRIMGYAHQ